MAQHGHHRPHRYHPAQCHRTASLRRPFRPIGISRATNRPDYCQTPQETGRGRASFVLWRSGPTDCTAQRRTTAPGGIPGRGHDHRRHRRRLSQYRPQPTVRPRPHRGGTRLYRRNDGFPQRRQPRLGGAIDPAGERQQPVYRHGSAGLLLAAAVGRHGDRISHRRGLLGGGTRICRQSGGRRRHLVAGIFPV